MINVGKITVIFENIYICLKILEKCICLVKTMIVLIFHR